MTTIADLYAQQQSPDMYQPQYQTPPQQYEQPPMRPTKDELDLIIDDINQDTEEEEVVVEPKKKRSKKSEEDRLTTFVKEGLIIVAVYVVLSGSGVRKFFAGYISQLNRDETGHVPLAGLVIYGAIIASLFILLRQYVFKSRK